MSRVVDLKPPPGAVDYLTCPGCLAVTPIAELDVSCPACARCGRCL